MEQHQSDKLNDKDTRNERASHERSGHDRPGHDRPGLDKSNSERSEHERPGQNKPVDSGQRGDGQRFNRQNQHKSNQERTGNDRQGQDRPGHERPDNEKPTHERSGNDKQPQNRGSHEKSGHDRPGHDRQNGSVRENQHREERNDRSHQERPSRDERAGHERPGHERPVQEKANAEKAGIERANTDRLSLDKPAQDRLVVGISLGDYNGVGPEVILKALQYNQMQRLCTPVIYGSMRVLNRYRNVLNLKDWNLNGIQHIGQASHKLTNVITCWSDQGGNQPGQPVQEIQPGKVTPEAGQAAFACLQRAVEDLKAGKLDALVTAPINKYNIQSEEFKFPGHTEYLAEAAGASDSLMFLVSERLRVGVVTGHIPLGKVRAAVTREKIQQKLDLMMQSLKLDFGINKPRIAVLGLNPHAGEEGLLGNDEQEIIKPLINDLRNKGQLVYGPFAADGFFGTRSYKKFDAVLAMYHDQGLIPFKTIAFDEGVNFTAGLPIIRTSPDHGTAYDIAGKGIADETSMVQAIYLACDIARQRKENKELEANKLQKQQAVEK